MSLKIITGRGGSGKSTYMLNDMSTDGNSIYIVPEQFSFSAEKKIVDAFDVAGLGNPQVLSFMHLADLVFAKYGAPQFISDNASYEMLVSYCANSIKPDRLKLFEGLVKKSELTQTASLLITTFKRYSVTPSLLEEAIEKTENELLKKKLTDSLIIYNEYLSALKAAGISDRNDTLSVLSDLLNDEECDFLSGKHIYIDQFADFDPSEYSCIKAMLKRAERVVVALCTDNINFHFETVNRTYNKLLRLAQELGIEIEAQEDCPDALIGAKPMIKHLEKCYFTDDLSSFSGDDGSIRVFCGKNKFSEIHNVGREIVHLVRNEKIRYKDISIIARDAHQYQSIIERVFPFYDIPVFADRKLPLSGHSITAFIMSILNIATGGFSYENIFSYIKSPFSPITPEESDALENYCIAAGINSYSWKKPFRTKKGIYNALNSKENEKEALAELERINNLREKVYSPLSSLIKNLSNKSTVKELCSYLFDFFETVELQNKIRKISLELEANGENLFALQTIQVYNILIEIFNDIYAVLGEKILSLNEFKTTVFAGLQSVEIGTIPSSNDCVTLGSIDRIKGHGAKVVFLIGANSGIFPLSPAESGLFSDDDKKELEKFGIEMPPSLSHLAQSEQLLVYDALTCGGEKLFISYAASDNGTNALLPSEIIERIRTIFPDISYTDDLLSSPDDLSAITTKKAVFDILASKLNDFYIAGKPLSAELSAAAYYFSNDEIYASLLSQAIKMTTFSDAATRVHSSLVRKAIGDNMKTSITRLEAYNKCPFSYFAKYILKLEPKETFEVSASDSGSFLHDFLDKFSQLIKNSTDANGNALTWKTIDNDFIKLATPGVLQEILSYVNAQMLDIPRIKALFERLCKSAENAVRSVKRHIEKSDFIPLGYEISFDENGNFKPTEITLEDGAKVILRGRIDRADEFTLKSDLTGGKFVRIVDYKSSEKTLSLSDVYQGIQLQLFVYLSNLCDNGYKPAGILYCNLSDPIIEVSPTADSNEIMEKRFEKLRMNGIILSENSMEEHMGGNEVVKSNKTASSGDFNNMFKHLRKVIKKTAQSIYNGSFPIKCTKDACTWCEYSGLCRHDISSAAPELNTLKDDEIWTLLEEEQNEMD